jgi:hypothetical protein
MTGVVRFYAPRLASPPTDRLWPRADVGPFRCESSQSGNGTLESLAQFRKQVLLDLIVDRRRPAARRFW